jgi:hypothetical protein
MAILLQDKSALSECDVVCSSAKQGKRIGLALKFCHNAIVDCGQVTFGS